MAVKNSVPEFVLLIFDAERMIVNLEFHASSGRLSKLIVVACVEAQVAPDRCVCTAMNRRQTYAVVLKR